MISFPLRSRFVAAPATRFGVAIVGLVLPSIDIAYPSFCMLRIFFASFVRVSTTRVTHDWSGAVSFSFKGYKRRLMRLWKVDLLGNTFLWKSMIDRTSSIVNFPLFSY